MKKNTRGRMYADMLIEPKDILTAIEMLYYAHYLGFKTIGLSLNFYLEKKRDDHLIELNKLLEIFTDIENEIGVQIFYKVPYNHTNEKSVKALDPLKTLVYGTAKNEKEFRKLLKSDVNVIVTDLDNIVDVLKKSNLNLLLQTEKYVEISIKSLWSKSLLELQRTIKKNYKQFTLLNKELPLYIVSGAKKKYEMRNPYQIRSFLMLLGVREISALKLIEQRPRLVLEKTKPIILL